MKKRYGQEHSDFPSVLTSLFLVPFTTTAAAAPATTSIYWQVICTLLKTENHASTSLLSFYRPDALPTTQPTVANHSHKVTGISVRLIREFWEMPITDINVRMHPITDTDIQYEGHSMAVGLLLTPYSLPPP